MWYLQIDTLLILVGIALAFGLLSFHKHYARLLRVMPLVDIAFLCYVSWKLAVLYVGYVLTVWCFVLFLRHVKTGRKIWFFLLCIGCCVPLAYLRSAAQLSLPMMAVSFVGLAYNMLKAIDMLYYEYYTGENGSFEVYVNYMLFLPVITAGPVFRYRDFKKTWSKPTPLTPERFIDAVKRIIRGLFQKVVISAIAMQLLTYMLQGDWRWFEIPLIPFVSLAVLYFDMAGYASIAIGLGAMMGITVPENFKKPFQSASFTQFWRNWHVTVSDWIREHVFIIFSKKKLNKWMGAGISVLVMVLMGIWHDFTWVFFLDGILLGLILAVENLFSLGNVNQRKVPKWYFSLRCTIVIAMFAGNSMIFTMSTAQIADMLRSVLERIGGLIG